MKIYSKTRYVVVAVLGMLFLAKGYVEGQGMTDSQRLGANCNIICAASDTPDDLKACATFVCGEVDARPILQKAIDEASRLRVKCILLKGTYCINSDFLHDAMRMECFSVIGFCTRQSFGRG